MPAPLKYVWAFPTTCVGLIFLPLALFTRSMQVVDGVLELHGPVIAWLLAHCTLIKGGASAMTLGHVVLGRNLQDLVRTRSHERVHVAQAERWGPLFIPAYLGASLLIWVRGGDPYLDNPFEREAYANE